MTSLSGTAYMGGQNTPKRWGNPPDSKSGGIRLSLVIVDSHFIDWGTTQGVGTVVAHSWRIVDHCQTMDVDGCRQTVKLQSVLRLCSGFYRSKDPTSSIKVLNEETEKCGTVNVEMYSPNTPLCWEASLVIRLWLPFTEWLNIVAVPHCCYCCSL